MTELNQGEESVAFAVGGSGGHVLPALQIARTLPGEGKRILIGVGISENPFVSSKEFKKFNVMGKNFSSGIFKGIFHIFKGVKEARTILRKEGCTHVIGMGGYHSLPVILAAFYLKIPVTLYEPNLIPGKVNKFCSFFSKRTLVLFDEVKKHLYGSIKLLDLSTGGANLRDLPSKGLLRKEFGLDECVTTILVFGGSSGAKPINDLIIDTLAHIKENIQVIHLTGSAGEIKEIYKKYGIKVFVATFLKEMDRAWAACDFAICRSGAGTIKEALLSKTPTVLIPYPHAVNDHQNHNAMFMEQIVGGGKRVLQQEANPKKIIELIDEFICPMNRQTMKENISKYLLSRKGEAIDSLLL